MGGGGDNSFPGMPELGFDFRSVLGAHELVLGGLAEGVYRCAQRLWLRGDVSCDGTVFVRVLYLVVRFDAAHV